MSEYKTFHGLLEKHRREMFLNYKTRGNLRQLEISLLKNVNTNLKIIFHSKLNL